MNKLQTTQQKSEIQTLTNSLSQSVALAFERTGTAPINIDYMIKDILSEFPRASDETLTMAIRKGSLGAYGRTYKLTTQEICIWIREYIKSKKQSMI